MADNRRAYGLAQEHGIDTDGMTPKEVWDALREAGVTTKDGNEKPSAQEVRTTLDRIGMNDRRRGASKKIGLDFFKNKTQSAVQESREIPTVPKEAYGFKDKERLNTGHHKRHAEELGYKNSKDYELGAINFWNNGEGVKYYSNATHGFCKYNARTEEFLSVNSDGTIRTYFVLSLKKFERKVYQEKLYEI